jgi:hypothetical protein
LSAPPRLPRSPFGKNVTVYEEYLELLDAA